MGVPKRKHSNARSRSRRSHDHLRPRQLTFCPKCSQALPTHTVCPTCGYYMGRTVDEPKEAAS
jgi:large subunit ribosomal protein L32